MLQKTFVRNRRWGTVDMLGRKKWDSEWSYKRYRQEWDNTVQCCVSGVPKWNALSVHAGLGGKGTDNAGKMDCKTPVVFIS